MNFVSFQFYFFYLILFQVLEYMYRMCRFVTQVNMCQGGLLYQSTHHLGIKPCMHQLFVLMLSLPEQARCVLFPSLCPCILIAQLPLMSENMWCSVFCSYVSLLRMVAYSFIHVPAKDTNSSFFWLHSIPWCICTTFSLSSLLLMDIWVGSRHLLL